jgi:hypothetical protein
MSDFTTTPNLGLYKPTYDADDEMWGYHLNANADVLDRAFLQAGVGVFLPLAGGTVTGLTTFSGAGSGLAVSNNATVGGTATLGNGLANYITVAGNAGAQATISVAGAGPNAQLVLRGLGSGATGQINLGTTAGGGVFNIVGNSATGSGALRLTQSTAVATQMTMDLLTNTAGVLWNNVPSTFQNNWVWSGLTNDVANRAFRIFNTTSGTVQDPVAGAHAVIPINIVNTFNSFNAGGIGARGMQVWSQLGAGTMGPTISGLSAQVSQTGVPGFPADWAAITSYPTVGALVRNPNANGTLYRVEVAGTSGAAPGPITGGNAVADGTVMWSSQGPSSSSTSMIGFIGVSTANFDSSASSGGKVGNQWGGVVAAQATAGAVNWGASCGLEIDDYWGGGQINKIAAVQIVRSGNQGTNLDWGLSIAAQPDSPSKWRNAMLFQSAVDANGYGVVFEDQSVGARQVMAGALDARMVNATGAGLFGGGFVFRWQNGALDNAGAINLRYAQLAPTAGGLSIDVVNQELQSLAVTAGGANWKVGSQWKGSDGSYGTVATVSGTAIATVSITIPSQQSTPLPTTVMLSAMGGNSSIMTPTGVPTVPTAATATPTYAPATTPTLALQPSGGATTVGGPLTGPFVSRGLYATGASVGNGADTTEDTLQTYVVPANTLVNVGDRIIIEAAGTFAASTDNKTMRVRFNGGTASAFISGIAVGQTLWSTRFVLMKTGANTQMFIGPVISSNTVLNNGGGLSLTDTASITITISGQNATNPVAGSITCRYMTVDFQR